MSFEYVCSKCGRRCKNAGALATHMKKHKKKEPTSASIMRFFKPASKKIAIEMKPIKKQPRQVKLNVKSRVKPSVTQPQSNIPVSRSNASDLNINASQPLKPLPPPRLPQSSTDVNLFAAPANLVSSDLDTKSPEFRLAHIRYFRKLKEEKFPQMDKSKYHAANEHALGVKLRRFQQWFRQEAEFKQRIKEKAKPKVEKPREQNKVVCQGEREHFTTTKAAAN